MCRYVTVRESRARERERESKRARARERERAHEREKERKRERKRGQSIRENGWVGDCERVKQYITICTQTLNMS